MNPHEALREMQTWMIEQRSLARKMSTELGSKKGSVACYCYTLGLRKIRGLIEEVRKEPKE